MRGKLRFLLFGREELKRRIKAEMIPEIKAELKKYKKECVENKLKQETIL